MFCRNCGSPVEDTAKFCGKCGCRIAQSTPPENQAAGQESPYTAPPAAGAAAPASPQPGGKPKGHRLPKRVGIIGAAVVVVVAALAATLNASALTNLARKTFSSPAQYYQYVEGSALSETASTVATLYENCLRSNLQTSDQSASMNATLKLGDEGRELLSDYVGEDLSWLQSVNAALSTSTAGNKTGVGGSLSLGTDQLLSCNCVLDTDSQYLYIQIPELSDTYAQIPLDDLYGDSYYDSDSIDEVLGTLATVYDRSPDKDTVEKILTRYVSTVVECIDNVDKGSGRLSAGGVSQTYTTLRVTINSRTAKKVAKSVLQEMLQDAELKQVILDLAQLAESEGVDPKQVYQEFTDSIQQALWELEEYGVDMDDVVMTVWVDSKGEIRGRKIEADGGALLIAMPKDGKKFGLELSYTDGYDTYALTGKGTFSGSALSGTFTLTYEETDLLQVKVSQWDTKTYKEGYWNGTFTFQPLSGITTMGYSSILSNYQLTLAAQNSKDSSTYEIGLDSTSGHMVTLTLSAQRGKGQGVQTPRGAVDLEDWVQTLDFSSFLNRLRRTEIPSDWIDALEQEVDYNF